MWHSVALALPRESRLGHCQCPDLHCVILPTGTDAVTYLGFSRNLLCAVHGPLPHRASEIPLTRAIGAVAAKFDRIGGVVGSIVGEPDVFYHAFNFENNYCLVIGK